MEGEAGPLALSAELHAAVGHDRLAAEACEQLLSVAESAARELPPSECDLLYGRAGCLYALLRARRALGPAAVPDAPLKALLTQLHTAGLAGAAAAGAGAPCLTFFWHGKAYLGAAHGTAGVLHIALRALRALGVAAVDASVHLQRVRADVMLAGAQLAALQSPSGNYPSSLLDPGDPERLVQFCHGAPGAALAAL